MPRQKKPLRAPFVMTVSVAAAATFAIACGGKSLGTDLTVEPAPPYNPPPAPTTCTPTTQPGDPCRAGESRCNVEGPAPTALQCVDGVWRELPIGIGNPPPPECPPAVCPATIPPNGASCTSCLGGSDVECTYPTAPDCPPIVATCDPKTLSWQVAIVSCNPPQPDAGADGGGQGGP
jgi:hypothetical protein